MKKNINNLKCFIDSDIILDTFLQRENSIYTDIILHKASKGELMLFTSPIIIANGFFVLSRLIKFKRIYKSHPGRYKIIYSK